MRRLANHGCELWRRRLPTTSIVGARGCFAWKTKRLLGMADHGANARLLLDRLGLLGPNANARTARRAFPSVPATGPTRSTKERTTSTTALVKPTTQRADIVVEMELMMTMVNEVLPSLPHRPPPPTLPSPPPLPFPSHPSLKSSRVRCSLSPSRRVSIPHACCG